jgi:hypothetical protein
VSDQAEFIARECEEAIEAAIEFCRTCSDDDWQAITPAEGWPVAATVRHIAEGGRLLINFAAQMAAGNDVTTTMAEVDAWNAAELPGWSLTTRSEAIALLQASGSAAAAAVRTYTDEQLAGEHGFAIYGQPRTVARMATGFALHTAEHLASIRMATTADLAQGGTPVSAALTTS